MTSSTTAGRKETERTKLIQEKCQTLLTQMLRDEDNKYCVDCDAKGPRWASWNLGVFLCIRCAGIHRNLGVHISRVKSVNLDTWTPEQVISLQQMGNSRARAVYEAQLPDGFRRPQTDSALESFIRAKYEHKKYLAREWVPPSPPKVDWAKEIDEELERQKRKKKAAQAGAAIGLGVLSSSNAAETKKSNNTSNTSSSTNAKSGISLPAPLSKPKSSQQNSLTGSSPKNQRISNTTSSTTIADATNQSNDLLGLTSPTKGLQTTNSSNNVNSSAANDFAPHDSFSGFLSAPSTVPSQQQQNQMDVLNGGSSANAQANSLAQEEEDFFNQGSLTGNGSGGGEKDASGKLTKDSILALYGSAPKQPTNPHMNFAGQAANVGNAYGAYGGGNFMNASPAQHQFMTPPNSTSLYNTPVMTAPAAFSAPGMSAGVGGMQQMGGGGLNFATQFPVQGMATNFGGMSAGAAPSMMNMNGGGAGPLMTTATMASNMNLMQTNQSLISGLALPTMQQQPQQQQQTMPLGAQMGGMMNSFPTSAMGMNMNNMGMGVGMGMGMANSGANVFQTTPNANSTSTNPQLNQQFGNLNIGNVWQ